MNSTKTKTVRRNLLLAATLVVVGSAPISATYAQAPATPGRATSPGPAQTIRTPTVSQTAPAATPPGVAAVIADPDYVISPEDILEVTVLDRPELSRVFSVGTDGRVSYPLVKQFKAAGMTLAAVEKKIFKALDKQYVDPQVTVTVRERRTRQVSILGSVRTPGQHIMREGWRVLDVVADSGGVPSDRLEFFDVRLYQQATGKSVKIDLTKLYADPADAENNPRVAQGDTITVQELDVAQTTVQVIGEVNQPRAVIFPRDGDLISVINQAGGVTPRAARSRVIIEREGKQILVDTRDAYQRGTKLPDEYKLLPGDKVIVPENKDVYFVYGAVGRGGTTIFPDDRPVTVLTAVADAGGAVNGADIKKTTLTRRNPDGTSTTTKIDVERMITKGETSQDMAVLPGDVVFVPAKSQQGFNINTAIGLLGAVPAAFYLFRVLGISKF